MSDYRFPTISIDSYGRRQIPVLPEGPIFDTIDGAEEVERIMARPAWSFEEADARLRTSVQKALAKKRKASGDRTKTTPTPKRQPNRKVSP
jgi:hypothetical protein